MYSVVHAAVVYVFLLVVFRIAGNRSMAEMTTFDFLLLLVVSEAVSQSLSPDDGSLTNALLAVSTLLVLDMGIARIKTAFPKVQRWLEGQPLVLVDDGTVHHKRMRQEGIDKEDILAAARRAGLETFDQVRHAVLETNGGISIVAWGKQKTSNSHAS